MTSLKHIKLLQECKLIFYKEQSSRVLMDENNNLLPMP